MEADPNATAAWLVHAAAAGRPRRPQISPAMYANGWREQPATVEQVLNDLNDKPFRIAEVDLDLVPEWNNQNILMLRLFVVLVENSGCQGYLGHVTLCYGQLDPSYAQTWVNVMQYGLQSTTSYREISPRLRSDFLEKDFSSLNWTPKRSHHGDQVVCDVPHSRRHNSCHMFFEHLVDEFMGELRLEACDPEGQRAGRICPTTGPAGVRPGSGRVAVVDFYVAFLS